MPRLPNLAVKASKARIAFPRLPTDVSNLSYLSFLKNTYSISQQNKIGLQLAEKKLVDDEFKKQLQQVHGHDDRLCRAKLQEVSGHILRLRYHEIESGDRQVNSLAAMSMWDDLKDRTKRFVRSGTSELLSSETEHVKLPAVGASIKGDNEKGNCWDYQTYDHFAKKVEKMNREVVFTRKLMDDSFQKAVSLVAANVSRKSGGAGPRNVKAINEMLARVSFHVPGLMISSMLMLQVPWCGIRQILGGEAMIDRDGAPPEFRA